MLVFFKPYLNLIYRSVIFVLILVICICFFKLGQIIDSNNSLVSIRLDIKQVDGQYVYTEKGNPVYPIVVELNQDEILDSLTKNDGTQSFLVVRQDDGFFRSTHFRPNSH